MLSEYVAFLLLWNPSRHPMNVAGEAEVLDRGGVIPGRWSVGPRTGGIRPGDELWLFRTGRSGSDPGVVRRGRAADEVFQAAHWSPKKAAAGLMSNYVPLEWIEHAPGDQALSRATLIQDVPGPPWATLQASGIGLEEDVAQRLRVSWDKHLAAATRGFKRISPTNVDHSMDPSETRREDDARPTAQQFILDYLNQNPIAFTADLLRVSKERRVSGDVMLALFKLNRDGEIQRDAGPPVRWSIANGRAATGSGVVDAALPLRQDQARLPSSELVDAHHVVELYLKWADVTWSEPQTRAALQSPNIERMTAFSRAELTESLKTLDVSQTNTHWDDWFEAATRRRSGTIRL